MKGKIFNAQEVQAIIAGNKTQFREVCLFQPPKFARDFNNEGNPIITLEADSKQERKWRPAQHMKQEQSRITLEITGIKVERLQDISEEDIKLEGFKTDYKILPHGIFKKDAIKFFIENWNATHKKPEEKFEANPFVWVVDFKINK